MKILYFDCSMGAAGDMLSASLLELMPDKDKAVKELNALGIPGIKYIAEKSIKCGIGGTHLTVKVNGEEEGEDLHAHHHDEYSCHSHEECSHEHVHSGGSISHEEMHDHEHSHEHEEMHGYENMHGHEHSHEHDHDQCHEHTHTHTGMDAIRHIVNDHIKVSDKVRGDILAVYDMIAEAESSVHKVPVSDIHFHEVGTMDAVADITAFCYLIDKLSPDRIYASALNLGSGTVKCAHGVLPVPAPATAFIVRGLPTYGSDIKSELLTPTGAALLKHFVNEYGNMPMMASLSEGCGMGKKDFDRANLVRTVWGESVDITCGNKSLSPAAEVLNTVCELSCNVDDMTGEEIGFALERFLDAGALDAYTIPIGMKKSRPGVMINVICRKGDSDRFAELFFKYTSTIGVRKNSFERYELARREESIRTEYGTVRKKVSLNGSISMEKYEYEDAAKIAKENALSLRDVQKMLDADENQ